MAPSRITRRRARNVVSDDEDDTSDERPSTTTSSKARQLKNQTLDIFANSSNVLKKASTKSQLKSQAPKTGTSSRNSTPRSSPRKAKQTTEAPGGAELKEKPIVSFFNKQPPSRKPSVSISPQKVASDPIEDDEDFIRDDDSFDEALVDAVNAHETSKDSSTALAFRKRSRDTWTEGHKSDIEGVLPGSQKFRKASDGSRVSVNLSFNNSESGPDLRPWQEKYGPVNLEELAVHKKKVSDVRTWLDDVFAGRDRRRLLVLKGSAGTGKTTTISLLADAIGYTINEWRNPITTVSGGDNFTSISNQFEDFLGTSGKFNSLDMVGEDLSVAKEEKHRGKQIILVEEFPNTFTRSSSAVQSFRSAIQRYLASNTPSTASLFSQQNQGRLDITPIVMIISETLLSSHTAAADSFTAHRLLGPEILNHPGTGVFEFNPIAPTYMAKALDLVIQKESRKTGRRKAPGPLVLKQLAEIGDIRSAISSLEFLCVRGDEEDGWGGKVTFTKTKKKSQGTPLTKMERESLDLVSRRESTLGIFHSVGKVVYNKREVPETPVVQPPAYLPQHHRPKASEVDVNALIDELGTDTQTFIAALHENYLLSCEGTDAEETVECISDCIESLSAADLLSPERFSSGRAGRSRFQFSGERADTLRQDELSFQSSVRSILFHLPNPVKRVPPPASATTINTGTGKGPDFWKGRAGGKADAHRMFYPTSLRLWQPREEMEGFLDLFISRAQRGELSTALKSSSFSRQPTKPGQSGEVESWQRNVDDASMPPSITSFRSFRPKSARVSANPTTASRLPPSSSSSSVPLPSQRAPDAKEIANDDSSATYITESTTRLTTSSSDTSSSVPPPILGIPRPELLLERLPYMALMNRTRAGSLLPLQRDLERLTRFTGGVKAADENADDLDEEVDVSLEGVTDRPVEAERPVPQRKGKKVAFAMDVDTQKKDTSGMPEKGIEGLVLEDDDIVSD